MCADGVYPGLLGEDVGIASNITAQAGEEKPECFDSCIPC
jgi:hypothetical protein